MDQPLVGTRETNYRFFYGASASAIGNIGPAFGDFGPTDTYLSLNVIGKWMLSFCMLLGRLEIFTVLVFINSIISKK